MLFSIYLYLSLFICEAVEYANLVLRFKLVMKIVSFMSRGIYQI